MNYIEHIIEPQRLWLAWQLQEGKGATRQRKIVAEIVRHETGKVVFRYLKDGSDFQSASKAGFKGFPAFPPNDDKENFSGVVETFVRRLPPRKREDFADYLKMYRLPEDFSGSDMALLAYTGAKLPGDGFEISADLTTAQPPLELILEVAGFRYQNVLISDLVVGDCVQLVAERENKIDPQAIAILHNGRRIGYVSKPYLSALNNWLDNYHVKAIIERLNGKHDRPLVYLFVKVR